MTVAELIALLQTQPQDLPVAFRQFSEYSVMEAEHIDLMDLQAARADGYIGDARPDKPTQQWLVFPGN